MPGNKMSKSGWGGLGKEDHGGTPDGSSEFINKQINTFMPIYEPDEIIDWSWDSYLSDQYVSQTEGSLDYDKLHPPLPDTSGMDNKDVQAVVSGSSDTNAAIGNLGSYWQEELGADPINVEAFTQEFGNKFDTDVNAWASDWGGYSGDGDPVWQGMTPGPDDWKKHGGKRSVGPDLEFMTTMETKFKSLETALGYNSQTDLIGETFKGYGAGIDQEQLRSRGDFPEIVIGEPNDEGKLVGGELVRSPNASGAWGDYLRTEEQTEETATLDKKDAKDNYDAELKTIRNQKKVLGQGSKTGLRGLSEKRSLTGLRRGGRRSGGFGRGDVAGLQAQQRELGGLREKARSVYNKKLERIVLDKKQDIETAANTLKSKVETEFTEMAGDVSIAKNTYQSDSLELEEDRAITIFDIFGINEDRDPAEPWPQDPNKEGDET